jgi:hypothetical protein
MDGDKSKRGALSCASSDATLPRQAARAEMEGPRPPWQDRGGRQSGRHAELTADAAPPFATLARAEHDALLTIDNAAFASCP